MRTVKRKSNKSFYTKLILSFAKSLKRNKKSFKFYCKFFIRKSKTFTKIFKFKKSKRNFSYANAFLKTASFTLIAFTFIVLFNV